MWNLLQHYQNNLAKAAMMLLYNYLGSTVLFLSLDKISHFHLVILANTLNAMCFPHFLPNWNLEQAE